MNTSETTIEIVTPDALGLDKTPHNPSPRPKHVEVKSKEKEWDGPTTLAASSKGEATVTYLQLLGGTALEGRIRKSMVETEHLRIYHCDLPAYTRISRTLCLESEFAYVCRGAMSLDLDGERHVLYEGDSCFIPLNVPHVLTALYNSQIVTVLSK
jgi:mannose-6-phosphate isomerase-like protein (cupin superfamily)